MRTQREERERTEGKGEKEKKWIRKEMEAEDEKNKLAAAEQQVSSTGRSATEPHESIG